MQMSKALIIHKNALEQRLQNTKSNILITTCMLVMSMTRHRMSGRSRTLRRNMSEMTTLEKSTFVMPWNPASYRCSERRELPQPGTKICGGGDEVGAPIREISGSRSWGHSAYHSKESPVPRIVKNLSQFSLLVKSPRVCRRSVADDDDDDWFFFFFPIFGLQLVTSLSPLGSWVLGFL